MSCPTASHHREVLEQCRFHTLDRYSLTDASITLTMMCGINAAPGKWGALSNTPATSVRKMTRKSSYAPRSVWKQWLNQEMIVSPLKIEQFCEESNTTSPCKTGTNPTSSKSRIASRTPGCDTPDERVTSRMLRTAASLPLVRRCVLVEGKGSTATAGTPFEIKTSTTDLLSFSTLCRVKERPYCHPAVSLLPAPPVLNPYCLAWK